MTDDIRFAIQRVPAGLQNVLNLFGPGTPAQLANNLQGVLELLQFYGLTQRTTGAGAGVVAEGATVDLVLSATSWTVLFAAHAGFAKTATMTALYGELYVQRGGTVGTANLLEGRDLSPFGATVTGTINMGGYLPYPLVCPPGARVRALPAILGTDATVSATVTAEFGVLG